MGHPVIKVTQIKTEVFLKMEVKQEQLNQMLLKLESLADDVKKLLVVKGEQSEDIYTDKESLNSNHDNYDPESVSHLRNERSSNSEKSPVSVQSIKGCEDLLEIIELKNHRATNSSVRLNVDGVVFLSSWTELSQYPETRLGKLGDAESIEELIQLCDSYDAKENEFYFKKRNKNFGDILEFYRTENLHISNDECVVAFEQDLQYWGIPASHLEICCARKLMDAKDMLKKQDDDLEESTPEQFPPGTLGKIQKCLWDLFEYPQSSVGAKLVGFTSVTSIILSIIILTLDTFPYFINQENKLFGDYYVFAIMEAVYIGWFTFELLIRLLCCPSKMKFLKQFMNWIDLLAILPYFIMLALHLTLLAEAENSSLTETVIETNNGRYRRVPQVFRLLRILKILRFIARFFKLARHSVGMQALGYTFRTKYKELSLVLLFLGMGAIIFASITFVFESDAEGSQFETMLDGYWWAVITMTTVGYGDISPVTRMGKVIGTLCAVFGVLIVALPIPIIGSSFTEYYDKEKRRQKMLARETKMKRKGNSVMMGGNYGQTNNGFLETPP